MPRRVAAILVTLFVLSLVPFACIYRARATLSPRPRIHLIQVTPSTPGRLSGGSNSRHERAEKSIGMI